jgi:hypothetical protein
MLGFFLINRRGLAKDCDLDQFTLARCVLCSSLRAVLCLKVAVGLLAIAQVFVLRSNATCPDSKLEYALEVKHHRQKQ